MLVSLLAQAVALFLVWLLLHAARHKLLSDNQHYYENLMQNYAYVPRSLQGIATVRAIAAGEILIALGLLLPFSKTLAAIACALLMLVYGALLSAQWLQGKRDMDCGCSGPAVALKISPALLWRNLVLALLALFAASEPYVMAAELWLALALAIVFSLAYSCWEGLLANAQRIEAMRSR
ncbi:MauE/DoxX family redox-associated membrane protein [Pseudoteredinibacter isoporae]|uniref:MauE/DoxX family redox-associated membrane protein n=1 Tax=Pseudoteredinibacter isoporae TaxID=570281 RepID=UPI0031076D4B